MPGSPVQCGVPINTPIELRFDRYLLPSTAVRQSILVYTGAPGNAVVSGASVLRPTYDVVERVVRFDLPPGETLQPTTLYTVELPVPTEEESFGFRAFDRAPLAPGAVPLRFSFFTSGVAEPEAAAPPPVSCEDVLTRFASSCTSCHRDEGFNNGLDSTPQGLDLSSGTDLLETAIGRVAHQTDLGTTTGQVLENPSRMGIDMPIIDPERPANSYLMYKLILKARNFEVSAADSNVCASEFRVGLGEGCLPPSPAERERLREWFVRGQGMPFESETTAAVPLYLSNMKLIQRWIRDGAPCP